MQYSEETAAAVAKAVQQLDEMWQRKFKQAQNDIAQRKALVDMVLKMNPAYPSDPIALLQNLHRFITEPVRDGES